MSSLLQHHGGRSADGRRVELMCYQVKKGADWERYNGPDAYQPNQDSTTFTDPVEVDGNGNPVLWRFFRKPKGMFGQFVVFRYNGEDHVPDLSVPIQLFKLPRDAERVPEEVSNNYWRS
jgi:hypothetical protein